MKRQVHLHFLDLVDGSVAAAISSAFGINIDSIRLHANSQIAESFGARAFACGDQIHFAPGELDPSTAEGWRVIGHELAHVVQQRLSLVPQIAGIVDDPELEREAHAAGHLAANVFVTGRVSATPFYPGPIPAKTRHCAIQCLMSLTDFKAASSASGQRDKVKAIDRELEAFHNLDKAKPRDYVALLNNLQSLKSACSTYLSANPNSARNPGIKRLQREIALEEPVLDPLAKYAAEADVERKWEHLEQAQETELSNRSKPDFKRPGSDDEITRLINQFENSTRKNLAAADVITRDINALRKLADDDDMPAILKLIIEEATNTANTRQLDLKLGMPGAAYNTSKGAAVPKYTLKHALEQYLGRRWRMGSLLHELTHISIAEIFDNTVLILAIRKDATDQEILHLAAWRRGRIADLKQKIGAALDLAPTLLSEMRSKVEYPVSGKLGQYLSNFQTQLGVLMHGRFDRLRRCGLDCELIEYDTVINQMALWCALSNIDKMHPVYAQLLVLAQEAYLHRATAALRAA
jgi:hypothetical protein